jgi:predicted DNA-binding WGR domain protein
MSAIPRPLSVHLRRIDSRRNMRRFYRMEVLPDLFGGVCLLREWGRIGYSGQLRLEHFNKESQAFDVFHNIEQAKLRKGYITVDER